MPELAKKIVLDPKAGKLTVNGEEFPYFIEDSINIYAGPLETTTVTVAIAAEEVQVLPWSQDA